MWVWYQQHLLFRIYISSHLSDTALGSGCTTQTCWQGTKRWHATANETTFCKGTKRWHATANKTTFCKGTKRWHATANETTFCIAVAIIRHPPFVWTYHDAETQGRKVQPVAVSILWFENCQSFFPTTAHVRTVCRNARRTAMRGAPQCAAHRNARRSAPVWLAQHLPNSQNSCGTSHTDNCLINTPYCHACF